MTKALFAAEFDRLCKGFDYKPRAVQADAFFERLQHCDAKDWHEAVTDLLCAPRFPINLDVILDAIEKRADQRRRRQAQLVREHTAKQLNVIMDSTSMQEACDEKPELMATLKRILN